MTQTLELTREESTRLDEAMNILFRAGEYREIPIKYRLDNTHYKVPVQITGD